MTHNISLEYLTTKSNLYVFDTSSDSCAQGSVYLNPVRQGYISLHLDFAKPLQNPISVLAYLEHSSLIEIDRTRNVITDF